MSQTALDRDIATALATGTTAREHLGAFLALDPTGRRGAPALRERQARAASRLAVISRSRYDREHPLSGSGGLRAPIYGDSVHVGRERYHRDCSRHRRVRWQLRKEQQRTPGRGAGHGAAD